MMSLPFGLFTQMSDSGPGDPLILKQWLHIRTGKYEILSIISKEFFFLPVRQSLSYFQR